MFSSLDKVYKCWSMSESIPDVDIVSKLFDHTSNRFLKTQRNAKKISLLLFSSWVFCIIFNGEMHHI
jgi:hypothetical protein